MTYQARTDKNPGIALFQLVVIGLITLPLLVSAALAALGLGWFSLVGGAVTAIVAYRVWRRSEGPRAVVLRIEDDELRIVDSGRTFSIAVSAIENVTLDKKEVKKLREGTPILPELMMVNATAGAATEIVRVVVEGAGRSFALTEEYQPYSAGLEGMGQVRVFLRKNGWVPETERWGASERPKKKKKRTNPE